MMETPANRVPRPDLVRGVQQLAVEMTGGRALRKGDVEKAADILITYRTTLHVFHTALEKAWSKHHPNKEAFFLEDFVESLASRLPMAQAEVDEYLREKEHRGTTRTLVAELLPGERSNSELRALRNRMSNVLYDMDEQEIRQRHALIVQRREHLVDPAALTLEDELMSALEGARALN